MALPVPYAPQKSRVKKSRTWCGTLHTEQDKEDYFNLKKDDWENISGLKYLIFGVERGDLSNRRHFQVFCAFENQVYLKRVKEVFDIEYMLFEEDPESPNFGEIIGEQVYQGSYFACKGNVQQNRTYCSKGSDYMEWGEVPVGQGHRTDIEQVRELAKAGKSYVEIVDEVPSAMRYAAGLEKYMKALNAKQAQDRGWKKKSVVIWYGETGSGKTRAAKEGKEDSDIFIWSSAMGKNFDGYETQSRIIIDEFIGDLPITFMNRLLDGNPFQVNVKYGSRWIVADEIYITSNKKPLDWWNRSNHKLEHREAVFRRVDRIIQKDIAQETEIAVGETTTDAAGESIYIGCLEWYRAAEALNPPVNNAPVPFIFTD